jgi:HK97 family phage prohead protease
MAETSPGDVRATERLHKYWVHGEGAAKIRWGEPNDFARCVEHLGKFIRDPEGYCNLAHKAATGMYPAQHAKELAGRADMADTKAPARPYGDVKYADPKNGKYPVDTEEHARAAWSYINMPKNASQYPMNGVTLAEVKAAIMVACKKFGIDTSGGDSAPASGASRAEYMRLYNLEDIHILRSADGGDGRTVEAYAAVFDDPAEIQDHEGHYVETIDPAAFNRAIDHASRARGGFPGAVKVLYNHGMTIQGTPSERFSVPIGVPVEIRAETRGLLTRTRYSDTPLAEEILESVRAGSITSQSFTGRIVRSTPQLRTGDRYRPRSGSLTTVRRTELGLREYGPVLWPAYSGAEILGVRMSTPGQFQDPGETEENDPGTPPDEGPATGDPLARMEGDDEHSARYHQHALYRLRSQELRESKGLVW